MQVKPNLKLMLLIVLILFTTSLAPAFSATITTTMDVSTYVQPKCGFNSLSYTLDLGSSLTPITNPLPCGYTQIAFYAYNTQSATVTFTAPSGTFAVKDATGNYAINYNLY